MNIFLACFLGCVLAIVAHQMGSRTLFRWYSRRMFKRMHDDYASRYHGPMGTIPTPIVVPGEKVTMTAVNAKLWFKCQHCGEEFEMTEMPRVSIDQPVS